MVGFTTDHRGLIFSVRRGAKSGGYVINVDASIIAAVDELKALLAEETSAESDSATANRPQSALSVREIQARLRRGRTVEQVAREAGVEPQWISRFAVPVLAEQAEVIRAARATRMTKQRNNISAATLGDAVYRNLAEREVTDPRDQLDKAWRARQLTEGMWLIMFTYTSRGRDNKAQWEYDEANRVVRARGRLGGVLGFREGPRRAVPATTARKPAARAKKAATKKRGASTRSAPKRAAAKTPGSRTTAPSRTTAAKKAAAAAPSTARQSPSRQATKRVAAARRAAAARLEAEAVKATRRDIAAVREAAKRPVVIPPRLVPPPMFGLFGDEPVDLAEPLEPDLALDWDAAVPIDPEAVVDEVGEIDGVEEEAVPAQDVAAADDVEDTQDLEDTDDVAPADDVAPVDDVEATEDVEEEDESEPEEEEIDPEPAPGLEPAAEGVPPVRRREPLRARPPVESSEQNGPVFRNDLAPAAAEVHPPRSAVGQSADIPLSMPLEPIEPPPRRRRLRPLRGR